MSETMQRFWAALGMGQPGYPTPGPMADGAGFAAAGAPVPLPPAPGAVDPRMAMMMAGLAGQMGRQAPRPQPQQLPVAAVPARGMPQSLPGMMLPGRR